jgi:hypothetical protein
LEPGAEVGVGADRGLVFDDRVLGYGAGFEVHVVAYGDVDEVHARVEDAVTADAGRPFQGDERVDHGVLADRNGGVDDHGGGVAERDAVAHQLLDHPALDLVLDLCELAARVHAQGFDGIVGDHGSDAVSGVADHRQEVGEVVLLLRVFRLEVAQVGEEVLAVENIDAGVHFVDALLFLGGVFRFHDARHGAALVAHDASVHGGIGELHGQQGEGVAVAFVLVEQALQRRGACEWDVAGEDQDALARHAALFEERCGLQDGVAGPELVCLHGVARPFADGLLHVLPLVSDDHHRRRGTEAGGEVEDVIDDRPPTATPLIPSPWRTA